VSTGFGFIGGSPDARGAYTPVDVKGVLEAMDYIVGPGFAALRWGYVMTVVFIVDAWML
jgi:hypothetical protein